MTGLGIAFIGVIGFRKRKIVLRKGFWMAGVVVLLGIINLNRSLPAYPENDLSHYVGPEVVIVRGQIDAPIQHRPDPKNEVDSTILMINTETVVVSGVEKTVVGRLRLKVSGFRPQVAYGDRIEVDTRLRSLTGFRNPGGFDYKRYLERQGFRVRAGITQIEKIRVLSSGGNPLLRKIFFWRENIRKMMVKSLSPEASAVLMAMIIGEAGYLTPPIRDAFMASGMAHILSISGSHISLVAFVVFSVCNRILLYIPSRLFLRMTRFLQPKQVAAAMTVPAILFYVILAGGQVATIRAGVMVLIFLGSVSLIRRHNGLNALALATLAVTLFDPLSLFDISFQLSYGAALAMILATQRVGQRRGSTEPESGRRSKWVEQIKIAGFLTASAGVSSTPLVAYYFNHFSWVGYISNIILTPLVGMFLVPLGLISGVITIAAQPDTFPLTRLHNWAIGFLMEAVRWMAGLPGAELHLPSPPIYLLILSYLAMAWVVLTRGGSRRRVMIVIGSVIVILLWLVMGYGSKGGSEMRITFLDVGQGDSTLIEFPNGRTMLIDGGGRYGSFDVGRLAVAPYLWDHWVRRVDYVVLSHGQADHIGGLPFILQGFGIGEVWMNGADGGTPFLEDVVRIGQEKDISMKIVNLKMKPLNVGDAKIGVLHPGPKLDHLRPNDRSVVVFIEYGRHRFLLTGDIEETAENEVLGQWDNLQSLALKVPHHGSRSSLLPQFLLAVCPNNAIISTGSNNPYGHPSPEAVMAFKLLGTRLFRTDRDGAVLFISDGNQLTIKTYRDFILEPVRWDRRMVRMEMQNWGKIIRPFKKKYSI